MRIIGGLFVLSGQSRLGLGGCFGRLGARTGDQCTSGQDKERQTTESQGRRHIEGLHVSGKDGVRKRDVDRPRIRGVASEGGVFPDTVQEPHCRRYSLSPERTLTLNFVDSKRENIEDNKRKSHVKD